ncbi:glycosyltransferase family 39 protein, partial [Candidatus Peregrinibacteria bacterium]|nr:glycosyltransferase family 39 protein [Candidatus Peregrinibacteria bacterium]
MLNFLLLNTALLLSAFLLTLRIFPESQKSHLSALSYGFFIYLSAIIVVQTLLGALGILSCVKLSVVIYCIAIITAIKYYKLLKKFKPPKLKLTKYHIAATLILLPLTAFSLVEFYNAIVLPVWEFDSIAYHMPMIRHYALSGNLWDVFYSAYAGPVSYYPASGDLLYLWNVLSIGNDSLANITNSFLLAILALTAYCFARQIKLDKGPALLFTALLAYSPILLKEVGTIHVDLFMTLSLLYVLIFLHKFGTNKNPLHILTTGAALGLFIGTKYLAVPFAVIPTAIFLYLIIKHFKKSHIKYLLAALLISIFTGAFWYLRNWIIAKNPLYPAEFLGFTGYKDLTAHIKTLSLSYNLEAMDIEQIKAFTKRYFFRSGAQALLIPLAFLTLILSFIFKKLRAK